MQINDIENYFDTPIPIKITVNDLKFCPNKSNLKDNKMS